MFRVGKQFPLSTGYSMTIMKVLRQWEHHLLESFCPYSCRELRLQDMSVRGGGLDLGVCGCRKVDEKQDRAGLVEEMGIAQSECMWWKISP